jgi:hypothetical protein
MACLALIVVLAFPRIVLIITYFFSNHLQRAYHGLLIPVLGFIFLPLTTLVYAWLVNTNHRIEGTSLLILILAVLIDAGALSGGTRHRGRW